MIICIVMFIITDINECLDTCSHHCINTEGSYHCECFAGYIFQPNKYDCEGKICSWFMYRRLFNSSKSLHVKWMHTYIAIYCLLMYTKKHVNHKNLT